MAQQFRVLVTHLDDLSSVSALATGGSQLSIMPSPEGPTPSFGLMSSPAYMHKHTYTHK